MSNAPHQITAFLMFGWLFLVGAVILTAAGCAKGGEMTFVDTQDPKFKVGQVWHYHTRPAETQSTLTICKIEMVGKLGKVIDVSIADVKIKSAHSKDGFATKIAHMPFAEPALNKSVSSLVREGVALPDYREGYDQWKSAVEGGKGGIWSVSVAEAVAAMESILNK